MQNILSILVVANLKKTCFPRVFFSRIVFTNIEHFGRETFSLLLPSQFNVNAKKKKGLKHHDIAMKYENKMHPDHFCDGYSLCGYTATVLPPSGVICDLSYTI